MPKSPKSLRAAAETLLRSIRAARTHGRRLAKSAKRRRDAEDALGLAMKGTR